MNEVAITGIGLLSPLGRGQAIHATTMREGVSGLRPPRDPVLRDMKVAGVGAVNMPGDDCTLDRVEQLSLLAAQDAVSDSGLAVGDWPSDTPVCVSTSKGPVRTLESQLGELRKGLRPLEELSPDSAGRRIARELKLNGNVCCRVAACATGLVSVLGAAREIAGGRAHMAIAGAGDASLTPFMHAGFGAMGALASGEGPIPAALVKPFDENRNGFLLGEGAAVFVLESLQSATGRGARIHSILRGWSEQSDAYDLVTPRPGGETEFGAAKLALQRARCRVDELSALWLHGTATTKGDPAELAAADRLAEFGGSRLPATATKGLTGHMLGASGAVELGFAITCMGAGFIPAVSNLTKPLPSERIELLQSAVSGPENSAYLLMSAGFGGHISAAVLSSPKS